jgi:hypothetical protein
MAAAKKTASSTEDKSQPLVDRVTYTEGTGYKVGNAAAGNKFMTAEGKIVDDLKGEPGWQVVVKGAAVTPEQVRLMAEGGPNRNAGAGDPASDES